MARQKTIKLDITVTKSFTVSGFIELDAKTKKVVAKNLPSRQHEEANEADYQAYQRQEEARLNSNRE